jgi:hypothetical protein
MRRLPRPVLLLGAILMALALPGSGVRGTARVVPFRGTPPGKAARYFGNMPFSVDLSSRAPVQFHFTAQHIAQDSNLVAFHMDWFPIPWREFASGSPLPRAWLAEIDRMAALKDTLRLPVYLAVTPIGEGNRLKPRAYGDGETLFGDGSFGRPCERISTRPDYAAVATGYHAFVDYLVRRFDPKFLALSIEVSNYAMSCPAAWDDMKDLLNAEYASQKAQHPDLLVFHTFQVDGLWQAGDDTQPCFGFRRDCVLRNFAPLSDLKTDLAALSVYPIVAYDNNGGVLPDDYLSLFGALTDKPVAVAETGFPADTVFAPVSGQCIRGLPSSPAGQVWWMTRLLADAEKLEMPFVVWWANHAPLSFESLRPCRCDEATAFCDFLNALPEDNSRTGFRFFGLMALRDYDGTPQPALAAWKTAVGPRRF